MIQCTSAASARAYYSEELSRQTYYDEGQGFAGRWGGKAAERLGLSGEVTRDAFVALCENHDPSSPGARLTARTRDNRTVGYDMNFHAPKGVSAVQALGGDTRIIDAFRDAVDQTMREIERDMHTRVRTGKTEDNRRTGNAVWAEFVHFTARPVDGVPDCHLHQHNMLFNATYDQVERKWKAGQFRGLKRDAPYYEAAFHSRFASGLEQLGYRVERTPTGWDLKGVPESVKEKFSRRTAEIEAIASQKGITDPDKRGELGARTRESKRKGQGLRELRKEWDNRLSDPEREALFKVSMDASLARDTTGKQTQRVSPHQAIGHAVRHAFERSSVISEKRLLEAGLRYALGDVSPEWLRVESERTGLLKRAVADEVLVTTKDVLEEEQAMLAFARETRGMCVPLNARHRIGDDRLNAQQRAAVRHVMHARDGVIAIRGGAGTGKTTLMKEVVAGIEAGGHRVFAFAPTADASRGVLRKEGFAKADTVARLLTDPNLRREFKGQVIWVDEAGLLSVKQALQVFNLARDCNARVILTGDTRQHRSVERGDALRLLESHAGIRPAEVREIQRQRGSLKRAIAALGDDQTERGFGILSKLGCVHECADDTRHERLATEYVEAINARRSAIVVSPTHREGEAVTRLIRDALSTHGHLTGEEHTRERLQDLQWTAAQRSDPKSYTAGQVVEFVKAARGVRPGERLEVIEPDPDRPGEVRATRANGKVITLPIRHAERFGVYRKTAAAFRAGDTVRITRGGRTKDRNHRLENGALYTVKRVNNSGELVLDNGWTVPSQFGHVTHGYCVTSYAAQGKTVDRVLIAQGSDSFRASSREQFYVSASRARESVRVFTDDASALQSAIQRSGQRLSASELAHSPTDRLRDHGGLVARLTRYAELRHRTRSHERGPSRGAPGVSYGR